MGIETVGQLAGIPEERLQEFFGRWGTALYRKAHGEDSYEFVIDAEPKSISHSHTFGSDTNHRVALEAMLSRLCQKGAKRLRDAGLDARTVTLRIRYKGFQTVTRSQTLPEPTHLDPVLLATLRRLFERHWDRRPVRLIGIEFGSLSHGANQMGLFHPEWREKLERLAQAADALRDRFGFTAIQFGGSLGSPKDH
jgi:DNA polymerase IV